MGHCEDGSVVRTKIDSGIHGHAATTGDLINIADAREDPRFDVEVAPPL